MTPTLPEALRIVKEALFGAACTCVSDVIEDVHRDGNEQCAATVAMRALAVLEYALTEKQDAKSTSRQRCGAVLEGDDGETYVCCMDPAHVTSGSDHTDAMGLAQWSCCDHSDCGLPGASCGHPLAT